MDNPAIQNLEFLRQLIAAARSELPIMDALRLRMLTQGNVGMNANTVTGDAENAGS